ncbi:MAG: helix-turn-helix transcriptional regulator [Candidatus Beckwithbacteria bacterium]
MTKSSNVYNQIGKNIANFRQKKDFTQEKLALSAGLNRAYIGYIERGERKPTVTTLVKIAKTLDIKIHQLFT